MPANQRAHWCAIVWRAVCRVGRALRDSHGEQVHGWEVWAQAHRAAVPETGPLRWVLTLDGYRLAGSQLSAGSDMTTGGTP